MEIFQELHCTVKSTYKHFTEHMSPDKSQSTEQINKAANKKDNFSVDTVNLILVFLNGFFTQENTLHCIFPKNIHSYVLSFTESKF